MRCTGSCSDGTRKGAQIPERRAQPHERSGLLPARRAGHLKPQPADLTAAVSRVRVEKRATSFGFANIHKFSKEL